MTDFTESQPLSIEDVEAILGQQYPAAPPMEPFPDDPNATWEYWDQRFDAGTTTVPNEWVWERLRIRRDQMLAACDWRVVQDAPWDTAPWQAYRQALRDLPDSTSDPRQAVWPVEPQ